GAIDIRAGPQSFIALEAHVPGIWHQLAIRARDLLARITVQQLVDAFLILVGGILSRDLAEKVTGLYASLPQRHFSFRARAPEGRRRRCDATRRLGDIRRAGRAGLLGNAGVRNGCHDLYGAVPMPSGE